MPPELTSAQVTVSRPVGGEHIDIATATGIVVARHRLVADGTGAMIRDSGHVVALEHAAMAAASTGRPHRRKERIPPGPDALAAAHALRDNESGPTSTTGVAAPASPPDVIDLATYERAATGRNTLA